MTQIVVLWLESVDRFLAEANGLVHIVHQLPGVGGEQVDGFRRVDARAAAHGHEGVPGSVVPRVVDGALQALVGRLHPAPVEDQSLDAEVAHLVRDALGSAGGGEPGVRDDQDAPGPGEAEVVADLVR
jgi:hypothetical protein